MPPPPPARSRPFSIQEFHDLVSNALDIDPVPLPLFSFLPQNSDSSSAERTSKPVSYVHDDLRLLALDHPLLSLDNLSLPILPSMSPSTFFERVKSRAFSFVRRAKQDAPFPDRLPTLKQSRSKSFFPSKSQLAPSISAPINTERPHVLHSRSLFEIHDTNYPFSEPNMSQTHSKPRPTPLPIHRSQSEYSFPEYNRCIPLPPSRCETCITQRSPSSRSPSPYTSPRTPPLPTPPLSSSSFFSSPSPTYMCHRRGSNASTTSSVTSSIFPTPSLKSVKSATSNWTSRFSSSFSRLGSNPFSRSKSRLGLTIDGNAVPPDFPPSASTTSNLSITSQFPYNSKSYKYNDFPSVVSCREEDDYSFIDRVLTPDTDPFARSDVQFQPEQLESSDCSTRSDTPTIHSPIPPDSTLINYSFPPTPVSLCFSSIDSGAESLRFRYSPPAFCHLPPRRPPPDKPLPPTPKVNDFPVWTLCLSSTPPRQTRAQQANPITKRTKSAHEARVRFSSSTARCGSPFPLVTGLSDSSHKTLPKLKPMSKKRESLSRSSELQNDPTWPLPSRRTVVVPTDSEAETEDGSPKRGRQLNRGSQNVKPSTEFSRAGSPRLKRRHSIRFTRRSRTCSDLLTPHSPLSPPTENRTSSLRSASSGENFMSSTSCTSNDQQLRAITESFSATLDSDEDYATPLCSQSRTSHDSSRPYPLNKKSKTINVRTSLSSSVTYHTAKSRPSIEDETEPSIPYSWKGAQVINSQGNWQMWLLGPEGFLDGPESGEVKVIARSWSHLMEFCAAHQRVVIGRTASKPCEDDPVVLRIHLSEVTGEGMEMTLTLDKVSREPWANRAACLMMFQLPTPTTFGEVARYSRMGSVGQGVRRYA